MATVTRVDIIDVLVKEGLLPRQKATEFLEVTLALIIQALVEEKLVKLSSFGSFNVRRKAKRIGRNPKTKEEALITPRSVLSFKPSQYLKEKIQKEKATKAF